jgi:dienelactone hydrolase
MKYYGLFIVSIALLNGCQLVRQAHGISKESEKTLQTAQRKGYKHVAVQTETFLLNTYQRINKPGLPINIYIEGDGRSWITRSTISADPTPLNPVALKLAIADNNANVVYLSRPCQYTSHIEDEFCNPLVWTDERFSPKVIKAMNQAVDQIKKTSKAKKINLVGFSGGGGLAVLMAAHRNEKDIASVRTVAADLDIAAMTAYHHATPSKSSLNPKDYVHAVMHIPQIHFVGDKDQVVPVHIAQGFIQTLNQAKKKRAMIKNNRYVRLQIVKSHDHQKGWTESWARLLKEPL